jgi:hypothetical protein
MLVRRAGELNQFFTKKLFSSRSQPGMRSTTALPVYYNGQRVYSCMVPYILRRWCASVRLEVPTKYRPCKISNNSISRTHRMISLPICMYTDTSSVLCLVHTHPTSLFYSWRSRSQKFHPQNSSHNSFSIPDQLTTIADHAIILINIVHTIYSYNTSLSSLLLAQ